MLRRLRKGQSTAEYAIVIGLVIAAAVGMQIYVKRGIQAKVADGVDYTDPTAAGQYGIGGTLTQYEPQYTQTTAPMVSTRDSTEIKTVSKGGGVERKIEGIEETSRTGTQVILAPE